jgi:selenocysteine lyase/cysteine desulfurase
MVEHALAFDEITAPTATQVADDNDNNPPDSDTVIYLNHASQAPLDPQVQDLGCQAIRRPPWCTTHTQQRDDLQRIRHLYAELIDANSTEIAIMPSTAFAMTFAARNIQRLLEVKNATTNFSASASTTTAGTARTSTRNKILLLQDQMCSAVYPWQEIRDELGSSFALEIVPYPQSTSSNPCTGWTEAVLQHLNNDNTITVACLPPLHWSDGALLDLKLIGQICRSKNTTLIVDATQAVGIMPCSVQDIQPDIMACSIHKWLRGPLGASLVYVSPELHKTWIPLDQHGRSRDFPGGSNWDASKDCMGPLGYPEEYYSDARKFDSGGKPNPMLLPMLRKAMELVVERVNLQTCQAQLQTIIQPLLDWALHHGFTLTPGPNAYHLIGIRPTFLTPTQMIEIVSRLQTEHQIYIAVRCGAFRIAPYLDTTPETIQRFIQVFDKICQEYKQLKVINARI